MNSQISNSPKIITSASRSPQDPLAAFAPLSKIQEVAEDDPKPRTAELESNEHATSGAAQEDQPKSSSMKKVVFDYARDNSPIKDANAKKTGEKEQIRTAIQAGSYMYYSKQDVDALLKQIDVLQMKVENLSQEQMETLGQLEAERFHSEELGLKLQQQEKHFQDKVYSQMVLLNEKAKEQEHFIQSIKLNMHQMTQSFHEKSDELENKKKKLQKANKDQRELQKQVKELKEQLQDVSSLLEQKQELINQLQEQMNSIREQQVTDK